MSWNIYDCGKRGKGSGRHSRLTREQQAIADELGTRLGRAKVSAKPKVPKPFTVEYRTKYWLHNEWSEWKTWSRYSKVSVRDKALAGFIRKADFARWRSWEWRSGDENATG